MRKVAILLAGVGLAALSAVPAGAGSNFGPGSYKQGTLAGDSNTMSSADPESGKVMIFQNNFRQSAAVHCVGDGPRATLAVDSPAEGVSKVVVNYTDATFTEHPVIDIALIGSSGRYLGHGNAYGPKTGESGSITVPFHTQPAPGETMIVEFGMQVHAGCLPHPTLLGAPGSRFVEGGEVTFSSVEIG